MLSKCSGKKHFLEADDLIRVPFTCSTVVNVHWNVLLKNKQWVGCCRKMGRELIVVCGLHEMQTDESVLF